MDQQIRHEHGFDSFEGWAIQEIGDCKLEKPFNPLRDSSHLFAYLEVLIDDLRSIPSTHGSPRSKPPNNLLRPISSHPHTYLVLIPTAKTPAACVSACLVVT